MNCSQIYKYHSNQDPNLDHDLKYSGDTGYVAVAIKLNIAMDLIYCICSSIS